MKNLFALRVRNLSKAETLKIYKLARMLLLVIVATVPLLAFGSVESSLSAVQDRLVGTILPLAAMLGLGFAGLSFVMGNPNSRQHLVYAVIGAVIGFGAESIVSFIRGLIH